MIENKLDFLKEKNYISHYENRGGDDWILLTDDVDKVFISIQEILNHKTRYKGFEKIPLEIAIGKVDYDDISFDLKTIISKDATITYLKSGILKKYHKWYKEKYHEVLKSTFIVLTKEFFENLEPLDRDKCGIIDKEADESFFYVKNEDKFLERGEVLKFIEKIGFIKHKSFSRINEIYVPPVNFDNIVKTLKEERILFITGTPEYGKTYTAVKLLWSYFKAGHEPFFCSGSEESKRIELRDTLDNINKVLKPGRIVYFEDPFGKTKYEKRESLEREIGTIIDIIKRIKDVYVVITTREEIFKEFNKEKKSDSLKDFEQELNLKKPSYNLEERKLILYNWAKQENCRWIEDIKLRRYVFGLLDKGYLPTPLNLANFAISSFKIIDKVELKKLIINKSNESAMVFAEEIMNMTVEKKLFLCFPLISQNFDLHFIKTTFKHLLKELKIKSTSDFDSIVKWFIDDKISITITKFVEFTHPSYIETLKYLLEQDLEFENIFSKLLINLSEVREETVLSSVAWSVAKNYGELPTEAKNLLFILSEDPEDAGDIAEAIMYYYDDLPKNVRNLLFNLLKIDPFRIAISLDFYFDQIPMNVRNNLLINLSKYEEIDSIFLQIVFRHSDKIPEYIKLRLKNYHRYVHKFR